MVIFITLGPNFDTKFSPFSPTALALFTLCSIFFILSYYCPKKLSSVHWLCYKSFFLVKYLHLFSCFYIFYLWKTSRWNRKVHFVIVFSCYSIQTKKQSGGNTKYKCVGPLLICINAEASFRYLSDMMTYRLYLQMFLRGKGPENKKQPENNQPTE